MQHDYLDPPPHLHPYIGSYYIFSLPEGGTDFMRAEMPNLRFFLEGAARRPDSPDPDWHESPSITLFGPTYQPYRTDFSPGTRVFGAAITPLGWSTLFGMPMHELADRFAPLHDIFTPAAMAGTVPVMDGIDTRAMTIAANAFFTGIVEAHRRKHDVRFIDTASDWLLHADTENVDTLKQKLELSSRQTERLSHRYLGAPPKKAQRKYRAIIVSNRLAWCDDGDWRTASDSSFCDQPHFIREFRQFIGCTPGDFVEGTHLLVREALTDRVEMKDSAPFSLMA